MAQQELGYIIHSNVILGQNCTIENGVEIGTPSFGKKDGELPTKLGNNAVIRQHTTIYAGVEIGHNFQTGPNVLIREDNRIGDDVVIWHGATLNPANDIGHGSRIHAGCFLEQTTLGECVFLGPNVTFTDDPHPMIPLEFRDCWGGATVGDHASIGGGVTVVPNVSIGERSVVGAGSVVTENIPAGKLAVGNPARVTKDVEQIYCRKHDHHPYQK